MREDFLVAFFFLRGFLAAVVDVVEEIVDGATADTSDDATSADSDFFLRIRFEGGGLTVTVSTGAGSGEGMEVGIVSGAEASSAATRFLEGMVLGLFVPERVGILIHWLFFLRVD